MAALLWLLVGLAGGVLALGLLALATPVHLALCAERGAASRQMLRLRLFGGLTPWLTLADSDRPARPAAPRPRARSRRWRLSPARRRLLLRELPGSVAAMLGRIRVVRLHVDADIGLGDPAETGQLFGGLMVLNHAPWGPATRFALRPDFVQARVEGRAEAAIRLIPLALAWPALRLGWRVLRARR